MKSQNSSGVQYSSSPEYLEHEQRRGQKTKEGERKNGNGRWKEEEKLDKCKYHWLRIRRALMVFNDVPFLEVIWSYLTSTCTYVQSPVTADLQKSGGRTKKISWEPEGYYCQRLCTAVVPFWFPVEHLWIALMPFWLSIDHMSMRFKSPLENVT